MNMIRLLAYAVLSIPIVWVSRQSLRHPRAHGFARFLAFQTILGLFVLNISHWFRRPFGVLQIASWLCLCLSGLFVIWGFMLLRRLGGFRPTEEAAQAFAWEKTGRLVTTGVYRYIRHPMYSSLLFLAWGVVLKLVTLATLALGVVASLALFATAKAEEAENVARFGEEYREYMRRTRRFVPFLL